MVEGIGNKVHTPILGNADLGGVGGADKTGMKGNVQDPKNDKGLTETQQTRTSSILGGNTPEIDKPNGKNNTKEIADQLINTLGKLDSADMGKGLFVLLQVIQLLQKAMNEMQQSMQVMRQAETNLAIANIEAEAETMESAATFGLWMGVISSVIQIGASTGSMISGFKGFSNTMKAKATGEQLKTAQTEMEGLKTEMEGFKTEMGNLKTELRDLNTQMGELNTQMTELRAANPPNPEAIAAKQGEIDAKQGEINTKQGQIDAKQTQIDNKQAEIDAKQLQMTGLKIKMDIQLGTAQSQSNRGQAISQFVGSFAGLAKAIGDGVTGGMQADAKRIEAQIKQVEASVEQTGKITQSVKDMLSALLSLMKNVSQTEAEATAQIFRGI